MVKGGWVMPVSREIIVLAIRVATSPVDAGSRRNARRAAEETAHPAAGEPALAGRDSAAVFPR